MIVDSIYFIGYYGGGGGGGTFLSATSGGGGENEINYQFCSVYLS